MTPLQLACKYGSLEVAELLIDKLEPTRLLDCPENLFHLIVQNKQDPYEKIPVLIEKLFQKIPSPQNRSLLTAKHPIQRNNILHVAILNDHHSLIKRLVDYENFLFLNEPDGILGHSPIHFIAQLGSFECFKLIRQHVDITVLNANGDNMLHVAVATKNEAFIEDVLVCLNGQHDIEEMMRRKNNHSLTPLEYAIFMGYLEIASRLEKHVNIDLIRLECGSKHLVYACAERNQLASVEYIFETFAKSRLFLLQFIFAAHGPDQMTVFHLAALNFNKEMIEFFLSKLKIEQEEVLLQKNRNGQTCFHIGCIQGHYKFKEIFIS